MPQAYAPFPAQLTARTRIAENFLRLTFHDPALKDFGTACLDQRIKLVFAAGNIRDELLANEDWFSWWREMDNATRPPFRTFTVRAVRPQAAEVDIDFAVHGATGPAAQFALEAPLGSSLVIVGPVQSAPGSALVGVAWQPGDASTVLIAGDETAAPAIGNILASLSESVTGAAFIEVESAGDVQDFPHPDGLEVHWLPRHENGPGGTDAPRGDRLTSTVFDWVDAALERGAAQASAAAGDDYEEIAEIDAQGQALLWDQSEEAGAGLFTWVAADAGTVARLRRGLRKERGLPRRGTSFMGYWRPGFSEV